MSSESMATATGDLPQITACNMVNTLGSITFGDDSWSTTGGYGGIRQPISTLFLDPYVMDLRSTLDAVSPEDEYEEDEEMSEGTRRIVQVFIVDPHEDVPLDKCLLYKSDQQFTDLTDPELYFELNIKEILAAHNNLRRKFLDKDATRKSGKDINLEPIKVRDLKMAVVTIAKF